MLDFKLDYNSIETWDFQLCNEQIELENTGDGLKNDFNNDFNVDFNVDFNSVNIDK